MPVDLAPAAWVARINDERLRRTCGEGALERGTDYWRKGHVVAITVTPDGAIVLGTVRGSRSSDYQVIISRVGVEPPPPAAPEWHGRCSCPMQSSCKHVVAVVLEARRRIQGAPDPNALADWERALGWALRPARGQGVDPDLPEMALQASLVDNRASGRGGAAPGQRVQLVPVVRNKKDKWVKTGVTWPEISRGYGVRARADQLQVVQEIRTAHDRTRNQFAYGYGNHPVYLDDFDDSIWHLLDRARKVGVGLVAASSTEEFVIGDPVRITLDVDTVDRAGPLTLRPTVLTADGEPLSGRVSTIGRPVHGVIHEVHRSTTDREIVLHPVESSVPEQVANFVDAHRTLTVPPEEVDRFLEQYYPALNRQVPVSARSGKVELPQVQPPHLGLDITHLDGHRAELRWCYVYPMASTSGSLARRVPMDSPQADAARDLAAESALVEALAAEDALDAVEHLRWRSPTGYRLRAAAATSGIDSATLVQTLVPWLEEHGVDVQVHGDVPDYVEAQEDPVVSISVRDSDQRDWFDLDVAVSIGEEQVPLPELLRALAQQESHLILDSGTYFWLERPELDSLRALVEEARDLVDKDSDSLRLSAFQAGWWEELQRLGVVAEQSARWQARMEALLTLGSSRPAEIPTSLLAELRHYQVDGFRWLSLLWDAGLGGVLADDMGLGKTLQTLAMVARAKETGDLADPVLVIAPTSVVGTWASEAARFAPDLRVVAVTETEKRREGSLAETVAGADIVVSSYTLVRLDDEVYREISWRAVVLDEAQFVKNHRSKTYLAIRRLQTSSVFAITGTPLENSLMDLWSILSLAAPGMFPDPGKFGDRYRKPIENGDAPEQLATLRRRIRPFVLRRTKDQVASDLPPKQEQVLTVPLAPAHRRIYDRHLQRERQRMLGLLGDMQKNRVAILAALTRLRQLALDPALVDEGYEGSAESAKIDLLVEHLQELAAEGHRVLVFSQFTRFLTRVRGRLAREGISTVYLDGRTRNRPETIAEFKDGDATAFLISLKAGGFGLTLTEADYVYVLDPWWNPAAESQAIDRTHRIGQDKPVMVYRLVSEDTIEEKVRALQERKRGLFDQVVDDEGAFAKALGASDIAELLGE